MSEQPIRAVSHYYLPKTVRSANEAAGQLAVLCPSGKVKPQAGKLLFDQNSAHAADEGALIKPTDDPRTWDHRPFSGFREKIEVFANLGELCEPEPKPEAEIVAIAVCPEQPKASAEKVSIPPRPRNPRIEAAPPLAPDGGSPTGGEYAP